MIITIIIYTYMAGIMTMIDKLYIDTSIFLSESTAFIQFHDHFNSSISNVVHYINILMRIHVNLMRLT